MNSALQVRRDSLNSTAEHRSPLPQESEKHSLSPEGIKLASAAASGGGFTPETTTEPDIMFSPTPGPALPCTRTVASLFIPAQ